MGPSTLRWATSCGEFWGSCCVLGNMPILDAAGSSCWYGQCSRPRAAKWAEDLIERFGGRSLVDGNVGPSAPDGVRLLRPRRVFLGPFLCGTLCSICGKWIQVVSLARAAMKRILVSRCLCMLCAFVTDSRRGRIGNWPCLSVRTVSWFLVKCVCVRLVSATASFS